MAVEKVVGGGGGDRGWRRRWRRRRWWVAEEEMEAGEDSSGAVEDESHVARASQAVSGGRAAGLQPLPLHRPTDQQVASADGRAR